MRTRSEAKKTAATSTRVDAADAAAVEAKKPNGFRCSVCHAAQFETPGGPSCENGHGGADGIEVSAALKEELEAKKRTGYDFPNTNKAKGKNDPTLRPDLERVVEEVFIRDIHEEWKDLEAALQIGEKRSEHGHAIAALDKAAARAYRAHRLYLTARSAAEAWEAENEVIFGAMVTEATHSLQKEKETGARSKQITDADVKARVATLFPDEWQAQERKRRNVELTIKSLERLAEVWQGRQRDLSALVGKLR